MKHIRLHDLLLSKAFASKNRGSTDSLVGLKVTRREFLQTATVSASGLSLLADPLEPRIKRHGPGLTVHYGGTSWRVDAALMGRRAYASWSRQARDLVLRLDHAFLPGTDLPIDFVARMSPGTAEWSVAIDLPSVAFHAAGALGPWMRGETVLDGPVQPADIAAGGSTFTFSGSNRLTMRPSFGLVFEGAGSDCVSVAGEIACSGHRLSLNLESPSESSLSQAMFERAGHAVTEFSLASADIGLKEFPLGDDRSAALSCTTCGSSALSGELYWTESGAEGVVLVEGPLEMRSGSAGDATASISFENAALLTSTGRRHRDTALAGRVSRAAHAVRADDCMFTIRGDDERPFYARFRDGEAVETRVQALLEHAWLPVAGADTASMAVRWDPIEIVLGRSAAALAPTQTTRSAAKEPVPGVIVLGQTPYLLLRLEPAVMRIRRSVDLLDLEFAFEGFDLEVEEGQAYLRRRRLASDPAKCAPATVGVTFTPQHLAEESFSDPKPFDDFPYLTKARLSAPSRIVFDISSSDRDKKPAWTRQPLTVEALTDWSDLALAVSERALEPDATFDQQMAAAGVTTEDTPNALLRRLAQTFQPPTSAQTALALAGRLVLSPSAKARWWTPKASVTPAAAPLWHARLDEAGRRTVRAIWADTLRPGKLGAIPATDSLEHLVINPSSANPRIAHWDIVAQSSVFVLPALRRLERDGKRDRPKSNVVRPTDKTKYKALIGVLEELDREQEYANQDTGVAVPKPFTVADVILTPLGASLNALWKEDPINVILPSGFPDATSVGVSLESLEYLSQLGRDIRVKIVLKGYQCPTGHRCAYVVLTERKLFKHRVRDEPVALLFKRRFIVHEKPEKRYPGPNQPFASRDFPANRVVMRTRQTPDLAEPMDDATGLVCENPLVFWPKVEVKANGVNTNSTTSYADVDYKWSVDDDTATATSNLLFIENSAFADPDVVKCIVEYYRTKPKRHLRTARFGGIRRRYAASPDGKTSFDTDSWLMSVRGRLASGDAATAAESFVMDGIMEGADQPSFYPFVEEASVNVQSLDRLLGAPQGLIRTEFNSAYVNAGFDTPLNKSEIYLNVVAPDIALDVTGQGGSTGGLVKPNALVVALSRKVGLIGGTRKNSSTSPTQVRFDAASTATALSASRAVPVPLSPYDFTHAQGGQFNPKEFFGGLASAKLLGLIPLDFLLKAIGIDGAPKLLETLGYDLPAGQAVEARLKEIAGGVQAVIARVTSAIGANVPFETLYPVLHARIGQLSRALDELIRADSLEMARPKIAEVVSAGREVLAEIERTLRDPTPTVVATALEQLKTAWNGLKSLADAEANNVRAALRQQAQTAIESLCVEIDRAGLGEVLFQIDPSLGSTSAQRCHVLLDDPAAALERIDHSLLSLISRPIVEALASVKDFEAEATGRIAWARQAVRRLARQAIAELAALEERQLLQPLLPTTQNDMADRVLAEVARAADAAIATGAGDLTKILTELDKVAADPSASVDTAINAFQNALAGKNQPETDRILQEFKDGVKQAVVRTITESFTREITKIRDVINATFEHKRARALERMIALISALVEGAASIDDLAKIVADARTRLVGWCRPVANRAAEILTFATGIADRALASADALTRELQYIEEQARHLEVPDAPETMRQPLNRAVAALKVALARVADAMADAHEARARLVQFAQPNTDACADLPRFLNPIADSIRHRLEVVSAVRDLLEQAANIKSALELPLQRSPAPSLVDSIANAKTRLAAIVRRAAKLLEDVTPLGGIVANAQGWVDVRRIVGLAQSVVPAVGTLIALVEKEAIGLVGRLRAIQDDPAALHDLATDVLIYAHDGDKRIAALVLQTADVGAAAQAEFENRARGVLNAVVTPLATLHTTAHQVFSGLTAHLDTEPIVKELINPEVVAKLVRAAAELGTDAVALTRIPTTTGFAGAKDVLDRWRTEQPALVRGVNTIADLAEHLLRGDLEELLNTAHIREAFEALVSELETRIAEFLPTTANLSYAWNTALGPVPSGDPIFRMTNSGPRDLELKVEVAIDLLKRTRKADVQARLAPFHVRLLGGTFDIATIYFDEALFKASNSAPAKFEAKVANVALGKFVEFLKPLQEWLSPGGSGFYIKPLRDRVGIEAGYSFDLDIISLGALNFVNVALGVSAQLPLTDYPALFLFNFASPERPFLISAPPYGGGGYVSLMANSTGIVGFALSFMAGAVVPIKFGPLSAQGRVVTGVYIIRREDSRKVGALVEAAGQGHIACFGVCVCLQIGLEDESGTGTLLGYSTYTFEFSVGITSVSFTFTASKSMSNSPSAGARAFAAPASAPVYRCLVPAKASNWQDYKKRQALNLLKKPKEF